MVSWLDTKLFEIFRGWKNKYTDSRLVGVELEFEGYNITPNTSRLDGAIWKIVPDGSLRGEAFEAVTVQPMSVTKAVAEVENLYSVLLANGASINDSMRAGVHVHVNCQNLNIRQLFTFMAAYYCLEDLLVEDLGEERAGNLFCLRLSDAEDISNAIMKCLGSQSFDNNYFNSEGLRYAAMNLVSLSKFGTLEFRALRTPTTAAPVIRWLLLLEELFKNSKAFADPVQLISAMSANGDREVVSALLPTFAKELFKKPHYEITLYNSIRNIQTWAYLNNWS